jgi:glycosyltransferase involved in cell wall biosynthesis
MLAGRYRMEHFQVGSEGRNEGRMARLLRLVLSPIALMGAVLARRVDLVHINTSLNPKAFWRDLAYVLAAKACGVRVLYQVHGGALPLDFFRGSRVLTWFLQKTLGLPDLIVVLARIELRAYREFVPEQRVLMLPNGIDCTPFATLAQHGLRSEPLRLVYIGRLAEGKGLPEILHALQTVHSQGGGAALTIAGSGPWEAQLRELVRELGIENSVRFAGPVFGEAKLALLERSDLFLLPSYSEGLPYAMMESMAAGVPVVVTGVGAIPDVVKEGVHGTFVEVGDAASIAQAIQRLDGDRELLECMGRACRRRISACYSMERLAKDFSRAYAGLCRAGRAIASA